MGALLKRYESRVERGLITHDAAQAEAARRLDDLSLRLGKAKTGGFFSKPEKVRGLYLWGGVGRGKSMLMDMFFDAAEVDTKRRVHFHAFMRDVHDFLADWRAMDEDVRKRSPYRVKSAADDPIAPAAKKVASEARLLCFDEFQVTQIADAMILSRLFEALFERGVTVVATSNREPGDLYRRGISRELFLPFIDTLRGACDVFELASVRDYRLERLIEKPVWHSPLSAAAVEAMDDAWTRLTLNAQPLSCELIIKGRKVPIPATAAGVARFTFEDLCAKPLGPRDYLEIAAQYHTIMIDKIPMLSPENSNEAARFVSLIDALYEAKINLVASAAAEPDALYPEGTGSFEFKRTASRLYEMRSAEYLSEERQRSEA